LTSSRIASPSSGDDPRVTEPVLNCQNSAHRSCERHHLHSPSAAPPQRRGRCGRSRATRVDVVDQAHARRRRTRGAESAGDVLAPLLQPETALAVDGPCPTDEWFHRQVPQTPELARERLGRPVPSLACAIGVGRDEGERGDVRPGESLDDETSGCARKPPPAMLLPGMHDPPGTCVVDDRGARRCERQPSPAALCAPLDRPGPGRPAAAAQGWPKPDQRVAAAPAERKPRQLARGATVRQQDVEEHSFDGTATPVTRA
jgi:hypothetical protein